MMSPENQKRKTLEGEKRPLKVQPISAPGTRYTPAPKRFYSRPLTRYASFFGGLLGIFLLKGLPRP